MSVIEVKINNKSFHIACPDGKESEIQNVAKKINEKIISLKESSPSATTEYLLLLNAISLQYDLDTRSELHKLDPESGESLLDEINNFSNYLETLAKKIKK